MSSNFSSIATTEYYKPKSVISSCKSTGCGQVNAVHFYQETLY